MKIITTLAAVLILALPTIRGAALGYAPAVKTLAPTSTAAEWKEVRRFTGTGNMRTPNFTVSSAEWRIRAVTKKTDASLDSILFIAEVHGEERFIAFNATKPGKPATMGKKPGTYWIDVTALFCEWHILIEERR